MTLEFRPYQADADARIRAAFRQHRRVCLCMPTGAGKTITFGHIAAGVVRKFRRALILVHGRELINQTLAKLQFFRVEAGVLAAGWPADPDKRIQVASVQTLARRLDQASETDLVIVDECHHCVAGQWAAVLAHYPEALILGTTATAERLDGRGLSEHFDTLVIGATTAELVAEGYLADVQIFTGRAPDLSGVSTVAGDYARGSLSEAMSRDYLMGDAVAHYRRHCDGQPAIAFCCTVAHTQAVAAQFRSAGYRAASVDGNLPTAERDRIINGLATGELQVVSSCDLISEGLDIPAVQSALLLRPTKSLTLYLQQIGRARRPKPDGSKALILDHAGNVIRHGDPSAARLWDLAGRPARLKAEAAAREEEERAKRRRQLERMAGELREWDPDAGRLARLRMLPYRQALRECPDEASLRLMAEARGYRPGWVWHVLQQRAERAA